MSRIGALLRRRGYVPGVDRLYSVLVELRRGEITLRMTLGATPLVALDGV